MMEEPRKINYALNIAGNLSVMLHAAFWVLKKTYKYYNGKKYKLYKDYEFKLANIASKANMFHFISHIVTIIFLIIGMIYFPRIYMHMHPQKIDSFPNYILVYGKFVYFVRIDNSFSEQPKSEKGGKTRTLGAHSSFTIFSPKHLIFETIWPKALIFRNHLNF